jgi:homoserine kinase
MALSLYNYLEVREDEAEGMRLEIQGEGEDHLSCDQDNLVCKVMTDLFGRMGRSLPGLHLRLENHIPIGKGLGSSAAAVAGALVAANFLLGNPLSVEELLKLGDGWEGHPDNVAAALLGGVVVTARHRDRVVFRRLDPPAQLQVVVAVPSFSLPTRESRRALPPVIPVHDAVFNLSRMGLLLFALLQDDLELLPVATEDRVHQPYREALIPGLAQVFRAAREAGALGVTLSGAGPTVVAFATAGAAGVGQAMQKAFSASGVECEVRILVPDLGGARIIASDGLARSAHRGTMPNRVLASST